MSNSWVGRLIGILAVASLIVGLKFFYRAEDKADIREAAYQRYSELAPPDVVKRVVDKHHDKAFAASYKIGGRRSANKFDEDRYCDLMDRACVPELQRQLASNSRQGGGRSSPSSVPHPAAPMPSFEEADARREQEFAEAERRRQAARDEQSRRTREERDRRDREQRERLAAMKAESKARMDAIRAEVEASGAAADARIRHSRGTHAAPVAPSPRQKAPSSGIFAPAPADPPTPAVRSDEQVDQLLEQLVSADARSQASSFRVLAKTTPIDSRRRAVCEAISRGLVSEDSSVRRSAAEAAGKWGDKSLLKPLQAMLAKDADVSERHAAMESLSQIGDPKAIASIGQWLIEDRMAAKQAIIKFGEAGEIEVLKLSQRSRDERFRREICEILGEIGTARSIQVLRSFGRSKDFLLKNSAERALEQVIERRKAKRLTGTSPH